MEEILRYFPSLSALQIERFEALKALYDEWNARINVISRKDMDAFYQHHVLHSLAIAKFLQFQPGTTVLDVGTGGGFPGIPLAIMFPEVQFTLIDSIGKKIRVATEIAASIGLTNVTCKQLRAEEEKGRYDFVVSRAVMPLGDLKKLVQKNISRQQHNALPNGLIVLKGGELQAEVYPFRNVAEVVSLSDWFDEEFFKTKKIIYMPL